MLVAWISFNLLLLNLARSSYSIFCHMCLDQKYCADSVKEKMIDLDESDEKIAEIVGKTCKNLVSCDKPEKKECGEDSHDDSRSMELGLPVFGMPNTSVQSRAGDYTRIPMCGKLDIDGKAIAKSCSALPEELAVDYCTACTTTKGSNKDKKTETKCLCKGNLCNVGSFNLFSGLSLLSWIAPLLTHLVLIR